VPRAVQVAQLCDAGSGEHKGEYHPDYKYDCVHTLLSEIEGATEEKTCLGGTFKLP
jgi:hypothetical protein